MCLEHLIPALTEKKIKTHQASTCTSQQLGREWWQPGHLQQALPTVALGWEEGTQGKPQQLKPHWHRPTELSIPKQIPEHSWASEQAGTKGLLTVGVGTAGEAALPEPLVLPQTLTAPTNSILWCPPPAAPALAQPQPWHSPSPGLSPSPNPWACPALSSCFAPWFYRWCPVTLLDGWGVVATAREQEGASNTRYKAHQQGDVLITSSFYSRSPEKSHQRGRDESSLYRHFTHPDILA